MFCTCKDCGANLGLFKKVGNEFVQINHNEEEQNSNEDSNDSCLADESCAKKKAVVIHCNKVRIDTGDRDPTCICAIKKICAEVLEEYKRLEQSDKEERIRKKYGDHEILSETNSKFKHSMKTDNLNEQSKNSPYKNRSGHVTKGELTKSSKFNGRFGQIESSKYVSESNSSQMNSEFFNVNNKNRILVDTPSETLYEKNQKTESSENLSSNVRSIPLNALFPGYPRRFQTESISTKYQNRRGNINTTFEKPKKLSEIMKTGKNLFNSLKVNYSQWPASKVCEYLRIRLEYRDMLMMMNKSVFAKTDICDNFGEDLQSNNYDGSIDICEIIMEPIIEDDICKGDW